MNLLYDFWDVVKDVWNTGVMGVDVSEFIIAFAILYSFFLLRQLISKFIIGWLRLIVTKTRSKWDDQLLDSMEGPLRLIPVALGVFITSQYIDAEGKVEFFASSLVRSLVAGSIFWTAFNLTDSMSKLMGKSKKLFTPVMIEWLQRVVKVVFIFIGVATVLEIWGIEVGPIIAGLGLFGVAVALGAQDMFKNLISGIWVIAERRFNKGDWILVEGVVEGTVESIGFRSTMVRRFDKAPVYVPNTKLSDNPVTNFSAMTHRRIKWMIGVEYATTVDQLRQIRDEIEAYILNNEDFAAPSEVSTFVRIDSFNDSSIDILLYCFTKTTNWGEWLEIKEKLAYTIKDIVENAGTGFAFPTQSIYVEDINTGADKFAALDVKEKSGK